MEIAKIGDTIQWSFPIDHSWESLAGKTFIANVGMIDNEEKHYGVHCEYGQDYIPFEVATIITRFNNGFGN